MERKKPIYNQRKSNNKKYVLKKEDMEKDSEGVESF